MLVLRQLLAFPMYATALWLAWILSVQSGSVVILLSAALMLAFGLWAFGASQSAGGFKRLFGSVPLVAVLGAIALFLPKLDTPAQNVSAPRLVGIPADPFSEARLEALRSQGRPVFVNATAAWCVTCLVNEKVAFDDARVRSAFQSHNVAYLVADWTRRDAAVTALLRSYGRDGVPLYLYYRPGAGDGEVLPQILTPDAILHAMAMP